MIEKLLKLLDIYCKGVKKHRNTNMKKTMQEFEINLFIVSLS